MSNRTSAAPAAKNPKTKPKIKPLRVDDWLDGEIKRVSGVIGLNEADTMRKAMERGLPLIEDLLKPAYKTAA